MTFNSCLGMFGIERGGVAFCVVARPVDNSGYLVQRLLPDMKLGKPELWERSRIEASRFYISREVWQRELGYAKRRFDMLLASTIHRFMEQ